MSIAPNHFRFAIQLKTMRHRAKLTQSELAELCGVGAKTISTYESGFRTHRALFDCVVAMAAACNSSVGQLVSIRPTTDECYALGYDHKYVEDLFKIGRPA